jgi:hypothetical protein
MRKPVGCDKLAVASAPARLPLPLVAIVSYNVLETSRGAKRDRWRWPDSTGVPALATASLSHATEEHILREARYPSCK